MEGFGPLLLNKAMTEENKAKKPRRKRRSKADIAAEKAKEALQKIEDEKMEEAGFEKVRNRDDKGHYIADDPSTPENEAWNWKKVEETPIVTPEPIPTPIPEPELIVIPKTEVLVIPEPEPEAEVIEEPEPETPPAPVAKAPVNPPYLNSLKRRRAQRRGLL